MKLRGVVFIADTFDHWPEPEDCTAEIRARFTFHERWLMDYRLELMIPVQFREGEGSFVAGALHVEVAVDRSVEMNQTRVGLIANGNGYYWQKDGYNFSACMWNLKNELPVGSKFPACVTCNLALTYYCCRCYREYREYREFVNTPRFPREFEAIQQQHPERKIHWVPWTHYCPEYETRFADRDSRN